LQIGFVQQKIYEFINKGYEAQNIAIVTPDESFAKLLKIFDTKYNLNLAIGNDFKDTLVYKKLDAAMVAIEKKNVQNSARASRFGDEVYKLISPVYYTPIDKNGFLALMEQIGGCFDNADELKIYTEELYKFEKILSYLKEMNLKSLLKHFMHRLSKRGIDDTRGGKITVMGVLETRAIEFDAVIIVDFDDANVPKKSNKDMFLNTALRKRASLPTQKDREDLQRHYYKMLFYHAKEVAISFVNSDQKQASLFLKQLGIKQSNVFDEKDLANIIFDKGVSSVQDDDKIVLEYSFKGREISATALKSYLECKRKYYYRYIKKIKSHNIAKDVIEEYEIGNLIHRSLANLYGKKQSYSDVEELKRDLFFEIDEIKSSNELENYLLEIQKKYLESFCRNEIERFKDGWSVKYTERKFSKNISSLTIYGYIDRVDVRDGEVEVLDYKTGSYNLYNKNSFLRATDFQMEFYYLLAQQIGEVRGCGFYDLKMGKVVLENFLDEKLDILNTHIEELVKNKNIEFDKSEDIKVCKFCEYKIMCNRF